MTKPFSLILLFAIVTATLLSVIPISNANAADLMPPIGELVGQRTENSKITYLGKIGNRFHYAIDTQTSPMHYKDNYSNPYEQWKDIDLTLVNGKITKAPYELTVDIANKSFTIRDKKSGAVKTFSILDIGGSFPTYGTPIISKNKITWQNIAVDTDLSIVADSNRVRITRTLKSNRAPLQARFAVGSAGIGDFPVKAEARVVNADSPILSLVPVVSSFTNNILTETVSDISKITKYPLEIDPTLDFTVGASTNDCLVYGAASFTTIDTASVTFAAGGSDAGGATFYGSGGRFTNVTIPSTATITTSYLTVQCSLSKTNTTNFTALAGEQSNNASAFSTIGDYNGRTRTAASVTYNSIPAWTIDTDYNSLSINTIIQELVDDYGGLSAANIVIFWQDTFGGSAANSGRFAKSYDASTTVCARLHIVYSIPAPTMSTLAPTLVSTTTVTLEGSIDNTGGENCTTRGFQYDTDSGAPYASSWSEAGSFSAGAYDSGANVTGLTAGDLYYYRAYAINPSDTGYGAETKFLMKPTAPSAFTATAVSDTQINLAWTKGSPAATTNTTIRAKLNSYPADVTDGSGIYDSTGTSYNHGGLGSGEHWYYRAWARVTEGGLSQWSDTYAQANAMTGAPPTCTTGACTGFTDTSAIVHGVYTGIGGGTVVDEWGFDYGLTASYGSSILRSMPLTLNTDNWANLTGLNAGTQYHYRFKVHGTYGWGYGDDMTFSTRGSPVMYEYLNTGGDSDGDSIYTNPFSAIFTNSVSL